MLTMRRSKSITLAILSTTMLVPAGRAAAQDAPPSATATTSTQPATAPAAAATPDANVQGDIVVTAQRRSESIQRVPISMQALSPETLAQHNVQSFDDYQKLLPSVAFQTLGPGSSQLFFRGIVSGKDGNPAGALPTAGVYLDDIPVTSVGNLLDVHIYDVARVEALSGPQGTLFGASSLAGTLRIITNKPDPSKVSGGYDLQLNKFGKGQAGGTAEGFVNVPLNDRTAVRIVGFYEKDGGYIDNTLVSRTYQRPHTVAGATVTSPATFDNSAAVKNNFNDSTTYGGRIALGIELNDDWTITPGLVAQEQHTNGTFLFDPKAGDLKVHDAQIGYTNDKWYQASLTVEGKIGDWSLLYSGGYLRRHIAALQDYSYYTVAYDSTPNYTYFQSQTGVPVNPAMSVLRDNRITKQTHEVRISSPSGRRFQVTGGLFYQRQTIDALAQYLIPGLAASQQGPTQAVTGDSFFLNDFRRTDRDEAVFAQADFKILNNLTLTGGIRGFNYRSTLFGFSGSAGSVRKLNCGSTYNTSCVNIDKLAKGSGETHKVSLSWQVTPDKMVYATYSTGFRPGGANRPVGFAPYDPDTLDNYEVGFKTSWFDRKLRLNVAAYHEVWKGIQYNLPGANGVGSYVNAGNARVNGMEYDLTARLHGFSLTAAGAYNDAKLTTPFCNLPNGVLRCDLGINAPAGTRLPLQPKFKQTTTARYDFRAGATDLYAQISMLNQTNSTNLLRTRDQNILGINDGFTTFDGAFGGKLTNNMTFEFFIQNMFDKRGILSRNQQCVLVTCLRNARDYPIKPQQFGIKVGQRF